MTKQRLKAIFDKHNFLTLATESDYEQISSKALRLAKKIEKCNYKLLLEIEKELNKVVENGENKN